MKRLLFFICTLLFANVLSARDFWEGDLKYEITGAGEVEVSDCNESITSVNIPSSVTHTWKHYSHSCDCYITDSVRTYSVTSIGSSAFSSSSLTSITIPNSITSIGSSAFYYCLSLISVTIPNSVTSIGNDAFMYCRSLTSVNIPNSVTFIGDDAFHDCSSLTSVTIPNSITSIGDYVFVNCSSLTSVTIPNSVTFIGDGAFYRCYSLTSVTCLATNPPARGSYMSDAFEYISTLYVPNGCRQAYENSFWADYFDCIVELGSGVSSVNLNVEVNNEEWGSVEVNEGLCGTDTLTAVAEMDCSEFLRWSDGDTNNPRVVNIASDTSFTAIFTDPVFDTTIHATIAQGETYFLNGHELSQSGVYSTNVLSEAGCEIYITLVLDVIATDNIGADYSSLSQTSLELLSLKPNPTKGLISFSKTIEKIEVVDISGKILLSFSNVREINIGDLPAGSYLLILHSNENSVLRKIVKE